MKRIWMRGAVVLLLTGSFILIRIPAQSNSAPSAPLNWQQQDVGATGLRGTGEQTQTGWRVQGAGADIWGGGDAFYFIYVPWDGDVDLIGRVANVEKTDPWAKAGLMIRSTLTETSPHAFIAWTPQKGAAFIRRASAGARSRDDAHQAMRVISTGDEAVFQQRGSAGVDQAVDAITPQASPRWLRLVRQGNVFRAYDSADGLNWEWLGTDSADLTAQAFVGMAVSSHDAAHLCTAVFEQISVSRPGSFTASVPLTGNGDGLQATYFPAMDLSGKSIRRVDANVNFDWGWGAPAEGIGPNNFSVRWEGELQAQFTEPYAIQIVSDDRARVWLNGELLIDEWYEHAEQASTGLANLEAGKRYLIRIEYFEHRGRAVAKLLWSSPSTPLQVIPQSQLYSQLTNQSGDGVPDLWKLAHGLDPADPAAADRIVNGTGLTARQLYASGFEPSAPAKAVGKWLSQDIGRVGQEGSAALSASTWTVQGSGPDIWANADAFHFLYQQWRGDGQIVAHVLTQDNTDPWAKAGLTMRTSLRADASHVTLALTPEHGLSLLRREASGQVTESAATAAPGAQPWLKLVRQGATVSAFSSADGLAWSWIDTQSLSADDVYVGLAVCSHDNSKLGTVSFDQVTVESFNPDGPVKLERGSGNGLSATYFDATTGRTFSRTDPEVNFDWDIGSPNEAISPDFFSVRWEGALMPESTEVYALHVLSDDGARLWLDGELLIDGWTDHGPSEQTAKVSLQGGRLYAIRVEYFERTGEAICKLLWSTPTIAKESIPQSQLYSGDRSGGMPQPSLELSFPTAANDQKTPSPDLPPQPKVTGSSAPTPVITGVRTLETIAGENAVASLGRWEKSSGSIYAVDRRGWLEYQVTTPADDIYRLQITGASHNRFDSDSGFYLIVSVDGESLGRVLLDAGFGQAGSIELLMPWLKAGSHRVRIFWDNARKGRSLELNSLALQALDGPDSNNNGIKDWAEDKLARENGIETVAGGSSQTGSGVALFTSPTSPACLEGRGAFLGMMSIRLADGSLLQPQAGINGRWFINVPLSAEAPVEVEISFQNGGRVEKCQIAWRPTNVLLSSDLRVRLGDSLLLVASLGPQDSPGNTAIQVGGVPLYSGPASQPVAYSFDQLGESELSTAYTSSTGVSQTGAVAVTVMGVSFNERAAAWVNQTRHLKYPDIPAQALIDSDPRLQVKELSPSSSGREFSLTIDAAEPRYLLVRLNAGGPILVSTRIDGFMLYSGAETSFEVVDNYQDGTQLIEMGLVLSPVLPSVEVKIQLVVGGVVFEDGTVIKRWQAADFDLLGQATVHFLRPALAKTSACHRTTSWEGAEFLGKHR